MGYITLNFFKARGDDYVCHQNTEQKLYSKSILIKYNEI